MSTTRKNHASVPLTLLACLGLSGAALADPLANEQIKFDQKPLIGLPIGGAIYNGHDELSTAYLGVNAQGLTGWQGTFMADDFADKLSTPIVHLSWWGSYINNPNNAPVSQFLISFESDVPGLPGTFSHPGTPLSSQIVNLGASAPGSGTFTEQPAGGSAAEPVYKYNAELNLGQAFPEKADTVYWLKIVALTADPTLKWGWHDRDYTVPDPLASALVSPGETMVGPQPIWHFQDDAVTGRVDIAPMIPGPGLACAAGQYGSDQLHRQHRRPAGHRQLLKGPGVLAVHVGSGAGELIDAGSGGVAAGTAAASNISILIDSGDKRRVACAGGARCEPKTGEIIYSLGGFHVACIIYIAFVVEFFQASAGDGGDCRRRADCPDVAACVGAGDGKSVDRSGV